MRAFVMTRENPLPPVLITALAIVSFSLMDALMKGASIAVGPYTALLYRSLIGAAIMLPVWVLGRPDWPGAAALRLHMQRGVVGCGMVLLFFYGLVRLPMAEAIALSFIAPLIALYLAAVMLGERIGQRAIFASLAGFAGVVVITIGSFGRSELDHDTASGIVAVLGSACLYALNLILQRRVAQIAGPTEITLAQNLVVSAILLVFAPWFVEPLGAALPAVAASAVLATLALFLLGWAYARAEAQVLVPIEYSAFVWAALFGWLFFSESVGLPTLAGAALIVVGCWITAPRRNDRTRTRLADQPSNLA